jgi:hypothetical protein
VLGDDVAEMQALIQYTLVRCQQAELLADDTAMS